MLEAVELPVFPLVAAVVEIIDPLEGIPDLVPEEAHAASLKGSAKPAHILWIPLRKGMLRENARIPAEHLAPGRIGTLLAARIEKPGKLYTPISTRTLCVQLRERVHRLRPGLDELAVALAGAGADIEGLLKMELVGMPEYLENLDDGSDLAPEGMQIGGDLFGSRAVGDHRTGRSLAPLRLVDHLPESGHLEGSHGAKAELGRMALLQLGDLAASRVGPHQV